MRADDEGWLEVNGFRELSVKPGCDEYAWWESPASKSGVFITVRYFFWGEWGAEMGNVDFERTGLGTTPQLAIEDLMSKVRDVLKEVPFHAKSVEDWLKHEWVTYGWEAKSN